MQGTYNNYPSLPGAARRQRHSGGRTEENPSVNLFVNRLRQWIGTLLLFGRSGLS